jgi:hypothetical protein
MVTTQVLAFVGLEVLERLAAHAGLADLSHHHLLAIGVATQVVVAIAGAALLVWLSRASERAASVLARPVVAPRPRPVHALATSANAPLASIRVGADPIRGPPPA